MSTMRGDWMVVTIILCVIVSARGQTECLNRLYDFENFMDSFGFGTLYPRIVAPQGNSGYLPKSLLGDAPSGPALDHTLMLARQGHILAFEQLQCRFQNITTRTILTPPYYCPTASPSSMTTCTMRYYYNMNGTNVGALFVGVRGIPVERYVGDQGTGGGWKEDSITRPFAAGEAVQFFFTARCSDNPTDYSVSLINNPLLVAGDIVLDDISITCSCPGQSTNCSSSPLNTTTTIPTTVAMTSGPTTMPNTTPSATNSTLPSTPSVISRTVPSTPSITVTTITNTVTNTSSDATRSTATAVTTSSSSVTSSDVTDVNATGISLSTTSDDSFAGESTSSGSEAVFIAIVAAVVALLLLLVVLLVIYRRKRKSSSRPMSPPSPAALVVSSSGSPDSGGSEHVKFNNPTYDGRDLTVKKEKSANGIQKLKNGLRSASRSDSQAPLQAAPSVPLSAPNNAPITARDRASPQGDRPDSIYDEPETRAVRNNDFYCQADPPKTARRSGSKKSTAAGSDGSTLPRYDHLVHEEQGIDPDVYMQPYQEPGNTPAAIYNQLSGQAYRHIAAPFVTLHERIGAGSFGIVFRGTWRMGNGMQIDTAVKQLRPNASEDMRLKLLQEAAIMGQFNHRNVVKLYGVVTDGPQTLMVVELMGEDLKTYLVDLRPKGPQSYSEKLFLGFSHDIAEGMHYLSSRGFVHRDLAARNVMLDARRVCKIGDFGMSRDLEDNNYYTSAGGAIPVKWTAPEAIHFKQYSPSSDVWSYGIVLYEIFTVGRKPYAGWKNEDVAQKVRRGYRLPSPENCRPEFYQLMMDCWHEDKHRRPTFSDIILNVDALQTIVELDRHNQGTSQEHSASDSFTKVTACSVNTSGSSPRAASPSVDTFALQSVSPEPEYDVAVDDARDAAYYTEAQMPTDSFDRRKKEGGGQPVYYSEAQLPTDSFQRRSNRTGGARRVVTPSEGDYDDVIVHPGGRRSASLRRESYTESIL